MWILDCCALDCLLHAGQMAAFLTLALPSETSGGQSQSHQRWNSSPHTPTFPTSLMRWERLLSIAYRMRTQRDLRTPAGSPHA